MARPSLVIAVLDPILMSVWTGAAPSADDVLACMAPAVRQAKAFGRCAMVVAPRPSMPLPDARTRAAIATEMRKLDPHLICGATVIVQQGLAGTAMRAVTSTLQLVSRTTHPEKVVATIGEAARFVSSMLASQAREAPPAEQIAAAFEDLTRRIWSEGLR